MPKKKPAAKRHAKRPDGPLRRLDENCRRMLGDPNARMRGSDGKYRRDMDRPIKDLDEKVKKSSLF